MRRARAAQTANAVPALPPTFSQALTHLYPALRALNAAKECTLHRNNYLAVIPRDMLKYIMAEMPKMHTIKEIRKKLHESRGKQGHTVEEFMQKFNNDPANKEWLRRHQYCIPKFRSSLEFILYVIHYMDLTIALRATNYPDVLTRLKISRKGIVVAKIENRTMRSIFYHGMGMLYISCYESPPLYYDLHNLMAGPVRYNAAWTLSASRLVIIPCGLAFDFVKNTLYNARTGRMVYLGPKYIQHRICELNEAMISPNRNNSVTYIDDCGTTGEVPKQIYAHDTNAPYGTRTYVKR